MDRDLEIEGELSLEFDGGSALAVFEGESLDVRLPNARVALGLFRQVSPSTRRAGLRRAGGFLAKSGLVGRVRIGDRTVATLGGTTKAGPLARLLGVDPMALSFFELIGAALDRRRGRPGEHSPS